MGNPTGCLADHALAVNCDGWGAWYPGAVPQLGYLPQIGETIDRYVVLAELAHGGMAAVYAVGRSTGHFDKLLAMKVMLPHLVGEKQFVDMFVDEARIAAHVQHPNVVQVFDVGQHKDTPFMVMEYLRGQSLSAVRRRVQLTAGESLEILARAAEGLHAAHETRDRTGAPLGVVHRDVSPQNIHVGYDGSVKVVDFGIAAAQGRITQTRTGEVKGKLSYAAPEQLRSGRVVDRRLDIWALGVIAWEMLAGQRLFKGESDVDTMYNVLNKTPARLSGVPAEVAEIVASCLQRNVDLRPANASEVAQVFHAAAVRLGADPSQLATQVETAFAKERAVEEERIASALGAPREPVREAETSSGPHLDHVGVSDEEYLAALTRTEIDEPRSKRGPWLAAAVGLLLVGGAVLFASQPDEQPMALEPIERHGEAVEPEAEPVAEADPNTDDDEVGSETNTATATATDTATDTDELAVESEHESPMRRRPRLRMRMVAMDSAMSEMDLMPVTF